MEGHRKQTHLWGELVDLVRLNGVDGESVVGVHGSEATRD